MLIHSYITWLFQRSKNFTSLIFQSSEEAFVVEAIFVYQTPFGHMQLEFGDKGVVHKCGRFLGPQDNLLIKIIDNSGMTFKNNMSTNTEEQIIPDVLDLDWLIKSMSYELPRPQVSLKSLANNNESAIIEEVINLFNYTDYRMFLQDYYKQQKEKNPFFSYRYFARLAGIGGQSYLQMIMNGKRNLSPKTVQKFTKALKFKKKEAQYFENLVLFNQAKKEEEKEVYFERLVKIKPHKKISEIHKDRYLYFTNKYLVIIREMVSLPHFKEDPQWISESLNKAITAKQVSQVIEGLLKLGLLARNEEGNLILSQGSVKTPADVESLEAYQYYRSIFHDAKEAIINVPFDKREVNSLTIPVSEKLIPQVKEIIQNSFEEIVKLVNTESVSFDDVYQVNTIFYPVTKTTEKKKK